MCNSLTVVYVIVSTPDDSYIDQLYLSLVSLRRHNPDVETIIVTEPTTKDIIDCYKKSFAPLITEIKAVCIPNEFRNCPLLSSRYLKTSLRRYISGNFIYIDCDTIVYRALNEDEISPYGHVCAVLDTHLKFSDNPYRQLCIKQGELFDWPIANEEYYFNSGFLYVDSSPLSYSFFDLWHSLWKEGVKHNIRMDQPSFAKANYLTGHIIGILNGEYNCQLKHGIQFLNNAIILHYLYNRHAYKSDRVFLTHDDNALLKLRESHDLPDEFQLCLESPWHGLGTNVKIVNGADYSDYEDYLIEGLVAHYNTRLYRIIKFLYRALCKVLH